MQGQFYRWQAQNGQKESAFKQLYHIAKVNGRDLDEEKVEHIRSILDRIEKESHINNHEEKLSPLDMFRTG